MPYEQYDNELRGAIFPNRKKKSDASPTHTGTIQVDGKEYWISAWRRTSRQGVQYMSLLLNPKDAESDAPQQDTLGDDDIPF